MSNIKKISSFTLNQGKVSDEHLSKISKTDYKHYFGPENTIT